MTETPSMTLRRRWLDALLPDIAFDGWTEAAAARAATAAGLTGGERALAAPNGVIDLIDEMFDSAQAAARADLAARDLSQLRTPDRVKVGVLAWLTALAPHREAVRLAASRGLLPWRAGPALQRAWSVADMAWTAAGDTSIDYNRYSKRALLAGVIPGIVLHWVDHPAPDDLDAFVAARLAAVSGLGQQAGRIVRPLMDLGNRFSWLRPR